MISNKCKIILAESSEPRAAVGMKNGHYKINKKSSKKDRNNLVTLMMAIIYKYYYSLVHIRCKIPEVICKGLGAIDTNLVSTSFPLDNDISEYDFRIKQFICSAYTKVKSLMYTYFRLTFGLVNFINPTYYITFFFRTKFLVQNNHLNLCVFVVN